MELVINNTYGGADLSTEAREKIGHEIKMRNAADRCDPDLVRVVKELRRRANAGPHSELVIVDIPNGYDYWIESYDGLETIHLYPNEQTLRNLIHEGNEKEIVNYVMGLKDAFDSYDCVES